MISPATATVPLDPDERYGKVCTDPQTFADWKGSIEKLCNETKKCIYIKELHNFTATVSAFKAQAIAAKPLAVQTRSPATK